MIANVPITVGSLHWAILLTLTFREYAVTTLWLYTFWKSVSLATRGGWEAEECFEVVGGAISEHTMQLGKIQAEDHLHEAKNAAAKIFE